MINQSVNLFRLTKNIITHFLSFYKRFKKKYRVYSIVYRVKKEKKRYKKVVFFFLFNYLTKGYTNLLLLSFSFPLVLFYLFRIYPILYTVFTYHSLLITVFICLMLDTIYSIQTYSDSWLLLSLRGTSVSANFIKVVRKREKIFIAFVFLSCFSYGTLPSLYSIRNTQYAILI